MHGDHQPTRNRQSAVRLGNLLIGCATPPIMLAAIGGQVMTQSLGSISRLSEDFLRGARLPVLNFPTQPPQDS